MREELRMSEANEDYLEAVYELAGDVEKPVRSVDIAKKLDVSKASVNKAISILKENGYVMQQPYGDVYLTEKGMDYGKSVFKRHLLLYHFLSDVLGVDDETAEEEACRMEHAISDDTLIRWTVYLENNYPDVEEAARANLEKNYTPINDAHKGH